MRRLLHIGLPKAGSSLLQRCFDSPETPRHEIARHLRNLSLAFNGTEQLYKDSDGDGRRQPMAQSWLEEKSIFDSTSCFSEFIEERSLDFVSSEGICGFSLSPLRSSARWAKALSNLRGNFDVLLITRNQFDWSSSMFEQIVQVENRYKRRLKFLDVYGPGGYINLSELNWLKLAETWEEAGFSVRVRPFESLLLDPHSFVESVEADLGRSSRILAKRVEPPILRYALNHLSYPTNFDRYIRVGAKRYFKGRMVRDRRSERMDFWQTADGMQLVRSNRELMSRFSIPDVFSHHYGLERH